MIPMIGPNMAPINAPPRTFIIQSKNSFLELFLLIHYKEKKTATMIIPPITVRTNPQIIPGIILSLTIKSISFFKLISKV